MQSFFWFGTPLFVKVPRLGDSEVTYFLPQGAGYPSYATASISCNLHAIFRISMSSDTKSKRASVAAVVKDFLYSEIPIFQYQCIELKY